MEINLTAYLLFMGCSAAACILWFFLAARKQMPAAKAGALSALTLLLGILLGIAGARLGVPMMDPLASVIICAFIVKAALDIFRDAVDRMVDHSCDAQTEAQIRACVQAHPGVRRIDVLRTREFGSRLYVELEIALDDALTLSEAHAIAEDVHDDVEKAFPQVKHIMIHVNPAGETA